MSILDDLNLVAVVPEPEPCRICDQDTNKVGCVVYCGCVIDDHGVATYDCGRCSDGLICVPCDDHFTGLEVSLSIFYY